MAKRSRINKRFIRKTGQEPEFQLPRPKTVAEARDVILDLLIANERYTATRLYADLSQKNYIDANETIIALDKVLKSIETNAEEKQFLREFRESLLPVEGKKPPKKRISRSKGERRVRRPYLAPAIQDAALEPVQAPSLNSEPVVRDDEAPAPTGLRPLLLHVLVAQFMLLGALLAVWLIGALFSYIGGSIPSMIFSIIAGAIGLIAFPVIISMATEQRWLRGLVRSPGFFYDMALGIVFVMGSILGAGYFDVLVWEQDAELLVIEDPAYLLDGTQGSARLLSSDAIYVIHGLMAQGPSGTHMERRRSADNKSSTQVYWYTRSLALKNTHHEMQRPKEMAVGQDISCLWLGWRPAGTMLNLSIPYSGGKSSHSHFRVIKSATNYLKAIADALNKETAPSCIQVLEHVPPPELIRDVYWRDAGQMLVAIVAAPWGLLLIAGGVSAYRMLREKWPKRL